jgi:hypothetical protein
MEQKEEAVICRETNQPVVVEQIIVEPPHRGEVMTILKLTAIDEAPQAFADLTAGRNAQGVILFE